MSDGFLWNLPFYVLCGLTILAMLAWPAGIKGEIPPTKSSVERRGKG